MAYSAIVFALMALQLGLGDRWWWLSFANNLTLYWFAPLVVLLPLALVALGARPPTLALVVVTGLFVSSFGARFVLPRVPAASGPLLTVATYNVFFANDADDAVLATLDDAAADVVAFQELGRGLAPRLDARLADRYPYRFLEGENALLSRWPATEVASPLADDVPWGRDSPPRVYRLVVDGRVLTLVDAHFNSSVPSGNLGETIYMADVRLRQIEAVRAFGVAERAAGRPVVLAADLNTTDRNGAWRTLTTVFEDAWHVAGTGLGHTWRHWGPLTLPIARIDYVLYTPPLTATGARLGRADGVSDHRPVVVTLGWR